MAYSIPQIYFDNGSEARLFRLFGNCVSCCMILQQPMVNRALLHTAGASLCGCLECCVLICL